MVFRHPVTLLLAFAHFPSSVESICGLGRYQNATTFACNDCPRGRFRDTDNNKPCDLCAVGKYSDTIRTSACISCPVGFESPLGSIHPWSCQPSVTNQKDGTRQGDEMCADGNSIKNDGCDHNGRIEVGFYCTYSDALKRDVCSPACGDYRIAGDETCDDGNAVSGDGCSSLCKIEPGFICGQMLDTPKPKSSKSVCALDCTEWQPGGRDVTTYGCNAITNEQPPSNIAVWCFPDSCPPGLDRPTEFVAEWGCAFSNTRNLTCAEITVVIASAIWDASGTFIEVKMNHHVLWPTAASCGDIFANAQSFGVDAVCVPRDIRTLAIELGRDFTIVPNDQLVFKQNVVSLDTSEFKQESLGNRSWPSTWTIPKNKGQLIATQAPPSGFGKLVARISSYKKVALAEDIYLDGANSEGGGGDFARRYWWSVSSVSFATPSSSGLSGSELSDLESTLVTELDTAFQYRLLSSSIAIAKVVAANFNDAALNATGKQPPFGQWIITYRLDLTTRFSSDSDSATWTLNLIPTAAVPHIDAVSPSVQSATVSSDVALQLKITAPWSLSVPSVSISWSVTFQNGTKQYYDSAYLQADPGYLHIPKRSMPVGTCIFDAVVAYQIAAAPVQDTFQFQVIYTRDVPVAILEAPNEADFHNCGLYASAARSFDPSLVHTQSEELVRPLPEASYLFEWKCDIVRQGSAYLGYFPDSVIQSWTANPSSSCPESWILRDHDRFVIHTIHHEVLLSIHVRVTRLGSLNVSSSWASKLIRKYGSNVAMGRPQVTFPVLPTLLEPGAVVDAWAVVNIACSGPGDLTLSVLNAGTGLVVPTKINTTKGPALQIIQSYEDINTMPEKAQGTVLLPGAYPSQPQYAPLQWPHSPSTYPNQTFRFYLLRINTEMMQLGGHYRLSLRMQHHPANAVLSNEISINLAPIGGTLFVSPVIGEAYATTFHIFATDWHDADLPLSFAFWSRAWSAGASAGKALGLDSSDTMIYDWSISSSISIPFPAGAIQILSRVRDFIGTESNVTVMSERIVVAPKALSDAALEAKLRALTGYSTYSPELFGMVDALIATQSKVPVALLDAAVQCLRKAQTTSHVRGSRSGSILQASRLKAITSMGNIDNVTLASTRSVGTYALSHAFHLWDASARTSDPIGMAREDAETYVECATNIVAMIKFAHRANESLQPSPADANLLEKILESIGYELGIRAANTGGSPSSIQTHDVTVGAYVFTADSVVPTTTPLPANPSIAALTKANLNKVDKIIDVQISNVGGLVMTTDVLRSATTITPGSSTVTSIVSAHRWEGNPFHNSRDGNPLLNSTSMTPVGYVLSATLFKADGKISDVKNVSKPILLSIPLAIAHFSKTYFREQLLAGLEPQCKFWDSAENVWKGDGCRVLDVRKSGTELLCSCTHLTSFATFLQNASLFKPSIGVGPLSDVAEVEEKKDMLWIPFLILVVLLLVWLGTVWCKDLGRYNLIPEDLVWRMHFRDDPLATKRFKYHREKVDIADEEDPEEYLSKLIKPFETGIERTLLFLKIFRICRRAQYFGFLDLLKAGVQSDIRNAFCSALSDVVSDHLEVMREERRTRITAQAAFRDPRLIRRLQDRLDEITHLAVLTKRRRIPDLPWSCAGFMSISCHGVHPWETRKPVRQVLGTDALVPVHMEIDSEGIEIFAVPKQIKLPWQGIPPAGWFKDHLKDPFMTASWATITSHQAVKERDVAKTFWDNQTFEKISRFEDRLERIAIGHEELATIGETEPGPGGLDARVLEICDQFDRHVVSRRFRDGDVMPPGSPSEEGLAPNLRTALENRSPDQPISGSGLEDKVRGWENDLLFQSTPQESILGQAFGAVGPDFEFWDLLDDQGSAIIKPGFRKNAMRLRFAVTEKPPPGVVDRWQFNWGQLENVKAAAALDEAAMRQYAAQHEPHVEVILYGLGPKSLVDLRETVIEFRGRCLQNTKSNLAREETAASRKEKWGQPERNRKNARQSWERVIEEEMKLQPSAQVTPVEGPTALEPGEVPQIDILSEVEMNGEELDSLEAKWAKAISGNVNPVSIDGPLSISGIEPLAPGEHSEWEVRIAMPQYTRRALAEMNLPNLDWVPALIMVGQIQSHVVGSNESPVMFRILRGHGSSLHVPLEGLALPIEKVLVHQLRSSDFPLDAYMKVDDDKVDAVRARGLESAGTMMANEINQLAGESGTQGLTVDESSRWDTWEDRLNGIAAVQVSPDETAIVPYGGAIAPFGAENFIDDLYEVLVVGDDQRMPFRALVKTQPSDTRNFAVDMHSLIQAQLLEDRFKAPEYKALSAAAAPPLPEPVEEAPPPEEGNSKRRRSTISSLGKKKKIVKSKAQLAAERLAGHVEHLKQREGQLLQLQTEKREQLLKDSFIDPFEETPEHFTEFSVKRFRYLFYDPCTLFFAVLLKTHPITRPYLHGWVGLVGVQRALCTSVYIIGSLVVASIFFYCNIVDIAEKSLEEVSSTPANITGMSAVALAWTTTTSAPSSETSYDDTGKLIICISVAVVSIFLSALPFKILKIFFKRHLFFAYVGSEGKRKTLGTWKTYKRVGIIIGVLLLVIYLAWIAYFISDATHDKKKDFLICASIIIGWMFFVEPGCLVCLHFLIVSIVRVTSRLDGLIEALGSSSTFNFTMFTADDASDQARQLAMLDIVLLTDETRARKPDSEESSAAPARPHTKTYTFCRKLCRLCCGALGRKIKSAFRHYCRKPPPDQEEEEEEDES